MWCKQYPDCAFLQYLRHIISNSPSCNAPADGLCSASRPTVLSVPVSRKLLGGRANKQDQQHSHRTAPPRHRRPDRLDSLRRVHRRNSRLHRGNPGLHRTRTLRRRPRPQYYTSSHILRRRNRRHDIRILPRRHTSRILRDSILPGTRKNRSSRNSATDDTTARKTTVVENFLKREPCSCVTAFVYDMNHPAQVPVGTQLVLLRRLVRL